MCEVRFNNSQGQIGAAPWRNGGVQIGQLPQGCDARPTNCWSPNGGPARPFFSYAQQQSANFHERHDILGDLARLPRTSPDRAALLDKLHAVNDRIAQGCADQSWWEKRGVRGDLNLRKSGKAEVQQLKGKVQGLERDIKTAQEDQSRINHKDRHTKEDFAKSRSLGAKIKQLTKDLEQAKGDLRVAEGRLNDTNARIADCLEDRFAPPHCGQHRDGNQRAHGLFAGIRGQLAQLQSMFSGRDAPIAWGRNNDGPYFG